MKVKSLPLVKYQNSKVLNNNKKANLLISAEHSAE